MVMCCPLTGGYDDGPAFSTTYHPRANKQHTCCECGEAILPGTRYELCTGKWDGEMSTYKTCLSCEEIRDHFACSGYLIGERWNDLEENFFPSMTAGGPCFTGLSVAARYRLFERRLAWLAELDEHERLRLVNTRHRFQEPNADDDNLR